VPEPTAQPGRRASPGEWVAAAALLLALPAIGLGIYLAGRGYVEPTPPQPAQAAPSADALDLISRLPLPPAGSPLKVTTPPKQWPAKRMYEKIDGEDKAYLTHGCVGLAAATLTDPAEQITIDLYLYQMTTPEAAEKVFAAQAPPEDAPDPAHRPRYVDIGDRAYLSGGCCYVRAGAYYLKLIAGFETPAATQRILELARQFARPTPTEGP